jgi:hypothetical protein
MQRRGVGPYALERAEAGAGFVDGIDNVEHIAGGARQAVQAVTTITSPDRSLSTTAATKGLFPRKI